MWAACSPEEHSAWVHIIITEGMKEEKDAKSTLMTEQ